MTERKNWRRLTSGLREEWLGNAACAADKREERREKREEILCRLSAMDFMVLERSGGNWGENLERSEGVKSAGWTIMQKKDDYREVNNRPIVILYCKVIKYSYSFNVVNLCFYH